MVPLGTVTTGNSELPFGKMLLMPLDNKKQCDWDKRTQYTSTSGSSGSAKKKKSPVVLPQSKHSESASELPASPPHELESGIFFMEQSKMEIHNDIQANPHPPYLTLLQLSKKSPVY